MTHQQAPQVDERHQWVVRLALDGHSTDDIAAHMNMPRDTVARLLMDVLKHLTHTTQH
ncbi:helix-turn-helix domain-containing protein [Limimonas halophila]|nr:helix-turn-helix domain-containing protein [Limimonas halophila]